MKKIDLLRQQIDACRAGTDDLSLPEFGDLAVAVRHDREVAEELSRSHALDRLVCDALHDVPAAAGLADRLMAAMQAETAPSVGLAERHRSSERDGAVHRQFGRRQWWLVGGAAALATLIAAFTVPFVRSEREVAQGELSSDVAGWISSVTASEWRPTATTALPKGIELDSAVNGKALQWQSIQTRDHNGWTGEVTAIDLRPAGQPRAMLFVVRTSARFAVPSTPTAQRRLALSLGFAATAWQRQERGILLVLVVEEDRGQRLEDFLRKLTEA
jgi:hypothetical protein